MQGERKFYAKLLLLGEYTTLLGGQALAIPFRDYFGEWHLDQSANQDGLKAFYTHAERAKQLTLYDGKFMEEFDRGLIFKSNIPIGYGLGSSGALTAAFYDRYVKKEPVDLKQIQQHLSILESHFHGESSGMDPLVSYFNFPVLHHGNGTLEFLMNEVEFKQIPFEIIDSGVRRSTKPIVKLFKDKLDRDREFVLAMNKLASLNNQAILAILSNSIADFYTFMRAISELQFQYMPEMIHDSVREQWSDSLGDSSSIWKLCGAGGGGAYLKFVTE